MSGQQSDLVNASNLILRSEHATLTERLAALEQRLELHRGRGDFLPRARLGDLAT